MVDLHLDGHSIRSSIQVKDGMNDELSSLTWFTDVLVCISLHRYRFPCSISKFRLFIIWTPILL